VTALLILLASSGVIHVEVKGDATEVLAFHARKVVARAPVTAGGVAVLRDIAFAEVDVVALGASARSEVVRRVRPVVRADGLDAPDVVLHARPARLLTVAAPEGAVVHVGGIQFPAPRVLLLPGLHRIVVDHPQYVSSAARLVRIGEQPPAKLEVELDSGLVVAGTVTGRDGKRLPGASVEVFTDGFAADRRATSDDNGAFHCAGFRGDVISLRVSARGHATTLKRIDFDPGSARARVAISLARGVSVTLPLAGAASVRATLLPRWVDETLEQPRLRMNDLPARSTGGSEVSFAGLTPGRSYRIAVEAAGMLPTASAPFTAGANLRLPAVTLVRAASVRGKVGRAGLMVVARGRFGDRVSRSAGDGSFLFDGLAQGKLLILVRDVDERGTTVDLKQGEVRELALDYEDPPADRAISGTVVDADREPLEGVRVTASGRSALTDAKGAFTIAGVALGRQSFSVRLEPGPECAAFAKDPHLPRIERKARVGIAFRAQLQRAGVLDLRWPKARLARATLFISGTAGIEQRRRIPHGARAMRIEDVPVGSYVVDIGAPGLLGTDGAVANVTVKGEPREIEVLAGRSVVGQVVRRRSFSRPGAAPRIVDEPIVRGRVTLLDGRRRFALATVTLEADGSFVLEGLPAATVLLCATAPGLPVLWRRIDLTRADVEDLVMPLYGALEGQVRVVARGPRLPPGTRVSVRNEYGVDMRDVVARGRFLGVVADDEDLGDIERSFAITAAPGGIFTHAFMAPGNYEFIALARGFKAGKAKVRVRLPWTLAEIGAALPEATQGLVTTIHLSPVPVASREEK